jgi:hypothetical protein
MSDLRHDRNYDGTVTGNVKLHGQNLRKRMATDRSDGWDRLVAECDLYCLPTGRRFELAGILI